MVHHISHTFNNSNPVVLLLNDIQDTHNVLGNIHNLQVFATKLEKIVKSGIFSIIGFHIFDSDVCWQGNWGFECDITYNTGEIKGFCDFTSQSCVDIFISCDGIDVLP